jgi:DUF1009 family protein
MAKEPQSSNHPPWGFPFLGGWQFILRLVLASAILAPKDRVMVLSNSDAIHSSIPNQAFGLLAGGGEFPQLIARAVRDSGQPLIAICVEGITDAQIAQMATQSEWVQIGQLNRSIQFLKKHGATKSIMAGRIPHSALFNWRSFDFRALKLATRMGMGNLRADRVLSVVSDEFQKDGIEIVDSTLFLKSFMPQPGLLTRHVPLDESEIGSVELGHRLAKVSATHDIGQTLVVKDGIVVAVEALEGTDLCIRRAGDLAGPGILVVKVSKPNQDLRFDVPVVGRGTIDSLIAAKARLLGISPGRSLLFNKDEMIRLAERNGITLMVLPEQEDGQLPPHWSHSYLST